MFPDLRCENDFSSGRIIVVNSYVIKCLRPLVPMKYVLQTQTDTTRHKIEESDRAASSEVVADTKGHHQIPFC